MTAETEYVDAWAGLPARLRAYWDEVELESHQMWYEAPALKRDAHGVLEVVAPYMACEGRTDIGPTSAYGTKPCVRRAGEGTIHDGVGLCSRHGGNFGKGKAMGAILMAFAYAGELEVSPWEALLQQVRMLANQVRWLQAQVSLAEQMLGAKALRPGGEAFDWVVMLEARGDRLAKVAKMAIDAGVAERFVRQMELEADLMVKAALETFRNMGLDEEASTDALAFMSNQLMALEAAATPWPDRENV